MKSRNGQDKRRASTSDILGIPNARGSIHSKWQQHYSRLVKLREQLRSRRGNMAEAARQEQPVFSLHMADAGTDQYDQDFALSMMSSEQDAMYEIGEAISRIRSGTYGICELTGQPIEAERLKAIPWTRFSLEAQRHLEQRGAVIKRKLAQPTTLMTGETSDEEEAESEE